jgi:hypothetical protein
VAAVLLPATATAEPAAPQPGSPCGEPAEHALTKVSDDVFLVCTDGRWAPYDGPYPSSDTWLSYGPALTLHGQGMRNPEMLSGQWKATPRAATGRCRAAQSAVVSAGEVGPTQVSQGEPGRQLRFEVLPVMFNIELSGDCVWQKDGW